MVRTVSPKASATPANPIPRPGKAAENTAAPHPPKTSQNVPKNSAAARLLNGIANLRKLTSESTSGPNRENQSVAHVDQPKKWVKLTDRGPKKIEAAG